MTKSSTFENVYTRYPFAPLVTLGLAIAAALKSAASNHTKSSGEMGSGGELPA